jgi:hypothetical protein
MGQTVVQLRPAIDRDRAAADAADHLHQFYFFVRAHLADSNKAASRYDERAKAGAV